MDGDLFFCVRNWRTTHYSKLEAFLHARLHEYRKKNEFFQVSLDLIEEGVKLFAETSGAHAFHPDVILVNRQLFNVEWIPCQNIFILEDRHKGMISATELQIRPIIKSWLDCVDQYGLLRFMSHCEMDKLVELLKKVATRDKKEVDEDLSAYFKRLNLNNF